MRSSLQGTNSEGSSYLCGASEGSNASAGHRTPAAGHDQSLHLPVFKARGRDFQEQDPSGADRARPAPAPDRPGFHASCSAPGVPTTTLLPEGELCHQSPTAPASASIAASPHWEAPEQHLQSLTQHRVRRKARTDGM